MTLRIFKRPQAEADIEECFVYIAEGDFESGITFLQAVEESLNELSEFPLLGKTRNFASAELRMIRMWHVKGHENYLIFYTYSDNLIDLIRILHGARDAENLFT
jgi:toxin ParE1/3/4